MSTNKEKLVFVIDDTRVYNAFIKNYLITLGNYRVVAFEDAENALKQLNTQNPDLIILDHNLVADSRVDGLYYLEKIKKLKPNVPVFFITGESNPELEKKVLSAGANKMMIKTPALPQELSKALEELSKPRRSSFIKKMVTDLFGNGGRKPGA